MFKTKMIYLYAIVILFFSCSESISLSRDEIKEAINNKSKEKVIEVLGKPEQTQNLGTMEMWYYYGISYDPIAETYDNMVQITFNEYGKVDMINFY